MTSIFKFALFVAIASVSACTIPLKESMFYNPPSVEPADNAAAMMFKDETDLTSIDSELYETLGDLLPATVTHGYLDAAEAPVTAYSLIEGDVEDRASRPLIVSCYGSGGDRPTHGVYYAHKLLPWGDVLQWDYTGYGDSPGEPSVRMIKQQRDAVVAKAEAIAGDRPLIYWGHSMGGFICPHMVANSPQADAMVYEASSRSVEETAAVWKPWYLRILPVKMELVDPPEQDDNAAPLKGFEGPVLVIAGGKDDVLPAFLSKSLFDALSAQGNDATYIEIADGDHINIPLKAEFKQRAAPFFAGVADLGPRAETTPDGKCDC